MKFVGIVCLSVMCVRAGADTLVAQETISYGTSSGRVVAALQVLRADLQVGVFSMAFVQISISSGVIVPTGTSRAST